MASLYIVETSWESDASLHTGINVLKHLYDSLKHCKSQRDRDSYRSAPRYLRSFKYETLIECLPSLEHDSSIRSVIASLTPVIASLYGARVYNVCRLNYRHLIEVSIISQCKRDLITLYGVEMDPSDDRYIAIATAVAIAYYKTMYRCRIDRCTDDDIAYSLRYHDIDDETHDWNPEGISVLFDRDSYGTDMIGDVRSKFDDIVTSHTITILTA